MDDLPYDKKRREENLIVCISKSEAEVTNNRRLRSTYYTIEATVISRIQYELAYNMHALQGKAVTRGCLASLMHGKAVTRGVSCVFDAGQGRN